MAKRFRGQYFLTRVSADCFQIIGLPKTNKADAEKEAKRVALDGPDGESGPYVVIRTVTPQITVTVEQKATAKVAYEDPLEGRRLEPNADKC